jgi:hypothetical protein
MPDPHNANVYAILRDFLEIKELNAIRGYLLANINIIYQKHNMLNIGTWSDLVRRYSDLSDSEHSLLTSKHCRVLTETQVDRLSRFSFMSKLRSELGDYTVTDEEKYGYPEMYWRIVRPKKHSDIGPLHADGWFWDINSDWKSSSSEERVKVWLPLEIDKGNNGLNIISGSHTCKVEYVVRESDGKLKPQIKHSVKDSNVSLLDTELLDLVYFHDRLIHGGAYNESSRPRVSLEFTCSIG